MSNEPISDFEVDDEADLSPRYDWEALAKKARSVPMKWVKVFDRDKNTYVETIRQGALRAMPKDAGFEARTRENRRETDEATGKEVRTCKAWVRYNPDLDFIQFDAIDNKEGGK